MTSLSEELSAFILVSGDPCVNSDSGGKSQVLDSLLFFLFDAHSKNLKAFSLEHMSHQEAVTILTVR